MRVYLAGPIFGCRDSQCRAWRESAKAKRTDIDWVDTMRRDYRGAEADNCGDIVRLDKEDIRKCDVVIANCPAPSAGTSMEIFFSHSIGIRVLAIVPRSARVSPWIAHHSTVVESLDEALAAL